MVSSVDLTIVGSIIMLAVSAPEISDHPQPRVFTKNSIPKSPYIIEGMPERLSVANLMILVILPCYAYSVRYIAAEMPIGAAIRSAMATI